MLLFFWLHGLEKHLLQVSITLAVKNLKNCGRLGCLFSRLKMTRYIFGVSCVSEQAFKSMSHTVYLVTLATIRSPISRREHLKAHLVWMKFFSPVTVWKMFSIRCSKDWKASKHCKYFWFTLKWLRFHCSLSSAETGEIYFPPGPVAQIFRHNI